jgi:hypothetical protein
MAITVQMQFESVVTEIYQDAFVGSSIENGTTVIQFDLRRHNFQQELGTQATLCWRKESYHVDVHELSTFHNPILYRLILAQGSYLNDHKPRIYFTPALKGVAPSQPMSHSVIRWSGSRAVVGGVRLRHVAVLFAALFLIPMTTSSIKRWMDAIGSHLPTPEERLRQVLALAPATEGHLDGYDPLGTDHGGMGVKAEHDRLLMTHEAASENGDDARQCLQRGTALGLHVPAAFSDYSQSCTAAITAVYPQARCQAAHCHPVKHIWGHRKKSLLSYRSKSKASGEAQQPEARMALAQKLWPLRGSLLKKPSHVAVEEKQAMTALESEDAGCVHSCRSSIRQLVHLFDHSHSAAQAKRRLQQRRNESRAVDDAHLENMLTFVDDHGEQALR